MGRPRLLTRFCDNLNTSFSQLKILRALAQVILTFAARWAAQRQPVNVGISRRRHRIERAGPGPRRHRSALPRSPSYKASLSRLREHR